MIYALSILTSTGFPFYTLTMNEEPTDVNLTMRFYDFVNPIFSNIDHAERNFELQAGLVSALYEFARVLGYPIELLKFKTKEESGKSSQNIEIGENSDVLITIRTELFLISNNLQKKIDFLYSKVISRHLPIGPEHRITDSDEDLIIGILQDKDAKNRIQEQYDGLTDVCNSIISEYNNYGLIGIVITSFDGNILHTHNIEFDKAAKIMRKIGQIPQSDVYQWKYRLVDKYGVYFINSGCGPKIEELFMPYYYILITTQDSFLGDSPTTIYLKLNAILDED